MSNSESSLDLAGNVRTSIERLWGHIDLVPSVAPSLLVEQAQEYSLTLAALMTAPGWRREHRLWWCFRERGGKLADWMQLLWAMETCGFVEVTLHPHQHILLRVPVIGWLKLIRKEQDGPK